MEEFYKGRSSCKVCVGEAVRAYRKANPEWYRRSSREYGRTDKARAKRAEVTKRARKEQREKFDERRRRWRAENPEKHKAHMAVNSAVRHGKLTKSTSCERCGARDVLLHAHHEDYSKPLEVEWLCTGCHGETRVSDG